jgi:hypothetical protein
MTKFLKAANGEITRAGIDLISGSKAKNTRVKNDKEGDNA